MDRRVLLAFAHDVAACALAWLAAVWLRFNLDIPAYFLNFALLSMLWVVPLHAALFVGFGLYRSMWRFASLPDLQRIVSAVAIGALLGPAVLYMLSIPVPRSALIISPVLLLLMMCGSRLAYRAWKERRLDGLMSAQREAVLVLGSEDAAVNLIKELRRSPQWRVVGMLDDDPVKQGRQLHGVPVLGRIAELPRWKSRLETDHAIIAMPEATHETRRRAVDIARSAGLKVLTVPSFDDLVSGRVTVSQIRRIELDDLLGRDPVVLDTGGLTNWLQDRVVLVTGAGGSIGSELCRQIARYAPQRLVLYELNELALYNVEQEFADHFPTVAISCSIGDVKDAGRLCQIIAMHQPSIMFHAAAYKHVPLMETENTWQAVLNNVLGTRVAAQAALSHGVEKFVLISTDKAVNPTNVMGATKRLAEKVCQSLQQAGRTQFVMVRFGNVLGSTGSVIPRFREQIARGGPLTVTHPEITRYFMSIPEAAQLVLQAGLMGQGGEIYILDMGEPVRIADLARDMVRLSGLGENDISIVYTGLRPGEKLYEEVLGANEAALPTPHAKLRVARALPESSAWLEELSAWLDAGQLPANETVKRELVQWVPEYRPFDSASMARISPDTVQDAQSS